MTVYRKIQIRNDTKANWASQNPTLLSCELGIENDTGRIKRGNGATAWNSLRYADEEEYTMSAMLSGNYHGTNLEERFANEIKSYTSVADWLHARCQANNFYGIHPGDYFYDTTVAATVDGTAIAAGTKRKCVIAGVDMYYNTGDTPMPHHLTVFTLSEANVMFNTTLNNNGSSYSANPYRASKLYAVQNGINNAATNAIGAVGFNAAGAGYLQTFSSALRNRMVEQRCFMPERYNASSVLTDHTGWNWYGRGMIFAPTEIEAYGCLIHSNKPTQTQQNPEGFGPTCHWPIFQSAGGNGRLTFGRLSWWLSSVAGGGTSCACIVNGNGTATCYNTTVTFFRAPLCFHIA